MRLQERREDLAEESSKGAPTEYDRIRLLLYILSESTDFQNVVHPAISRSPKTVTRSNNFAKIIENYLLAPLVKDIFQ